MNQQERPRLTGSDPVKETQKPSVWKRATLASIILGGISVGTVAYCYNNELANLQQRYDQSQQLSEKIDLELLGLMAQTSNTQNAYRVALKHLEEILGKPYQRPVDPNVLNSAENNPANPLYTSSQFYRFENKHSSLNNAFYEFVVRENTDQAVEMLHRIATEHLIEGMHSLNQALNQNTSEYVAGDGLKVKMDERIYDLENPLDFQLVYSLTYIRLQSLNERDETDETSRQGIKYYSLNENALLWLKDNHISINFTENSVLLIQPHSLASFSRSLRLMGDLGFLIPRISLLGPNLKASGAYIPHKGPITKDSIIDHADEYGSVNSLIHEVGHNIADTAEEINPELSQKAFNKLMEEIEKDNLPKVQNKQELYYHVKTPRAKEIVLTDRIEQYAFIFEEFLLNGGLFKSKIEKEKINDPALATIHEAQYNFFKKGLSREFVNSVLTQEELDAD